MKSQLTQFSPPRKGTYVSWKGPRYPVEILGEAVSGDMYQGFLGYRVRFEDGQQRVVSKIFVDFEKENKA